MYQDKVFCFTPKGDLISLPKGATAIDFAYAVHTDVGDRCVGVLINDKRRQLTTELVNGDQVSIITEKDASPRSDWEDFAKPAVPGLRSNALSGCRNKKNLPVLARCFWNANTGSGKQNSKNS